MILYGSKESEPEEVTITCWIAEGLYYGNKDLAMSAKSTHMKCPICGEPAKKEYVHCKQCAEKIAWEKYWEKEAIPYTGCPVSLFDPMADDPKIFWDESDIQEYLEETDIRAEDLDLISTEEADIPEFDALGLLDDYVEDENEITEEFKNTVDVLNKAAKGLPKHYYIGSERIQLPKDFHREETN